MIPGSMDRPTATVKLDMRRILVVDEALPIRRKMLEILHRTGLPGELVRHADTAEAALESFVLEHPDIVFTELIGADLNAGLEMVREMLTIDPKTRIILITAEAPDSPAVRKAVKMGVFAVIEKPLRQDKIRALIAEIEDEETGIQRFR